MEAAYLQQQASPFTVIGLTLITVLTFILPFMLKKVNDHIEIFFMAMGLAAVTVSWRWSGDLIIEALKSPLSVGGLPIGIFQVVLVFGLLIHYFNRQIYSFIERAYARLNAKVFFFLLILLLGLFSSILSVIVTAVILSEVFMVIPIGKEDKTRMAIIACFAIGLGAGLTPIGEPLSTIMVYKLAGEPYHAGFFFPAQHLVIYIIPGIILLAVTGWIFARRTTVKYQEVEGYSESIKGILIRSMKVYVFIAALILLGEGLRPLFELFLYRLPSWALYWINIISAILDNATLTAIEINPSLQLSQIVSAIMALLIAGGILLPGNIPNIVAAGRLRISMREWALIGVPLGLALMLVYFIVLIPVFIGS